MTASHYADFVKLQEQKDIMVVAFPCNQFGQQEPGTPGAIKAFAEGKGLKVNSIAGNFWLMNKVDVNGHNEHPVYTFLKKHSEGSDIMWNFYTKFMVKCDKPDVHGQGMCDIRRHDGQMEPSTLLSNKDEL